MFKKLMKHSIRSFIRQRAYIIINVLGLSIGITCSLFISLYIINEVSYDRYNSKKDRIYRLINISKIGELESTSASTSAPIGPAMLKEFPEIEGFLRMNGGRSSKLEYNNQAFEEDHILEADSSFFNFFSIPVLKGDPGNLLNAPHKVVLSESTARKIFGNENPIDKQLKIGTDTVRYSVSGVMEDIPENSHFEASIITSFMTNPESNGQIWFDNSYSTYLLLKPNSTYRAVDQKIPELLAVHLGPEVQKYMGMSLSDFFAKGNKCGYYLQNLKEVHLDTSVGQQFKASGNPKSLKILGSIALLIILIAAINFMNLSTAQASRRAKEVGIKKISGSGRGMLILQFLSESFVLSFVSLLLAMAFIKATLPYFNNMLGTRLVFNLFSNWYTVPLLILFSVFVGVLSGSYPAFYLSSFNPYEVLKGALKNSLKNGSLRRILVVFQFAVSIMLIVGTIIMYRQINFMLNKDTGFAKEQVIVISQVSALSTKFLSFKDVVKGIPGVINIGSSTSVPGRNNNNMAFTIEGRNNETFSLWTNYIDYGYLDTYGMKVVSGRSFNDSFTTDQTACLVNEAAIMSFGISDPEKARFKRPIPAEYIGETYYQVIGTVKNFNFESMKTAVTPYIFCLQNENQQYGYMSVKLSAKNYAGTIAEIEKKWKEFTANTPFLYSFIDDDFVQMYKQENQNAQMAVIFSVLAIFIAVLGLFGLTSFSVEQRTKEIGVRKACNLLFWKKMVK
jgi:putative ABC transport system permease protein